MATSHRRRRHLTCDACRALSEIEQNAKIELSADGRRCGLRYCSGRASAPLADATSQLLFRAKRKSLVTGRRLRRRE